MDGVSDENLGPFVEENDVNENDLLNDDLDNERGHGCCILSCVQDGVNGELEGIVNKLDEMEPSCFCCSESRGALGLECMNIFDFDDDDDNDGNNNVELDCNMCEDEHVDDAAS